MTPLAEQWAAILSEQPGDWSQLRLELRLADADRTERASSSLAPLNPWRRDDDYRIGILRFIVARVRLRRRTGARATRLGAARGEGVGGELRCSALIDAVGRSPRRAQRRRPA